MKILIVDDDPVSRQILQKILMSQKDYQVTIVCGGNEAWELLDDPSRYFDVVFLDITMPPPDGLEVLGRIKQSPYLKSLQVILCTASSDRATVISAIRLGAHNYLVKPCTEASVLKKLKEIKHVPAVAAAEPPLEGVV
jgi:two-component system chemotaxis response regulator CheY